MTKTRKIIEIDDSLCDGCGACILSCAEGALALVDGKAKLTGDVYCDGLGACIGGCPTGALRIVERQAGEFDQAVVDARLAAAGARSRDAAHAAGPGEHQAGKVHGAHGRKHVQCCPSAAAQTLSPAKAAPAGGPMQSWLGQWPVKLQLLSPSAPFLDGADLLLLADCAAAAYPDLHSRLLEGKAVAMGCPKLDDLDAHIEKLAELLSESGVRSLKVVHMEVPCCFGFVHAAVEAAGKSGKSIPVSRMKISRTGEVLEEEEVHV